MGVLKQPGILSLFLYPKVKEQSLFIFFSVSDIALLIKYRFHDGEEDVVDEETRNNGLEVHEESQQRKLDDRLKKRKIVDAKRINVIDYSVIKLPANMFGYYLSENGSGFVDDCVR